MSLLFLLLCASLLLQAGHCQVRVPGMVYAWLDSQVTLQCRADTNEEIKQVTWEIQISGVSVTLLTYRNDTGPRYHMSYGKRVRFKGNGYKDGSIEIFNVSLVDEGFFKCVFTTFPSGTIEGRIQLQVFVLPTVKQVLNKDLITPCVNLVAECLVSLAKPAAEIQWITNGIHYTSEEDSITHSNGMMSKMSRLYMTTTPDLFGRQIFCLVYQPRIPFNFQDNITTNVSLTNIQFPPQMVHIEVFKNDQEVQHLLCKSDANPRAEFIWKRSDNRSEDFLSVPSAVLNFSAMPGDGMYICEASNALGINRGFFYKYTSKGSDHSHLGILIAFSIVGLLSLLGACYMILHRKPSKESTTVMGGVQESERVRKTEITNEEDSDDESERNEKMMRNDRTGHRE
ncbi:nectin-1-like isoform X2 [Dendrobates tinctorius]|uniref:nectin-1-like isoform X2 n=1 Tax=Dendrobates tinctorius TaxID=92724 RepID=UPI003CC9C71F